MTTHSSGTRKAARRAPIPSEIDPDASVLYARVSSKEQELGYSIGAQQELLRPYARETGKIIRQEFEMSKRLRRRADRDSMLW